MLQRESLILVKYMYHESRRVRGTMARSMAAVSKPRTTTTKQVWRKTRKKIGPSTSKTVIHDATKDSVSQIRDYKISTRASIAKFMTDEEAIPEYNWVPPAYRGLAEEPKPGNNSIRRQRLETMQTNGMVRLRVVRPPGTDRYILSTKDWAVDMPVLGIPDQALIAKQVKEESIMNYVSAFKKAAASYRSYLCDSDALQLNENEDEFSAIQSSKMFQHQIESTIRSLHSGVTITSDGIDDSMEDFSSLCQILKQICSTAFHLSTLRKYNDQDANDYVDLAECTLVGLAQINQDRTSLMDRCNSKETTNTGWFNQIVEGLTPSLLTKKSISALPEADENDKSKEITSDKAMKRLLRNVMGSIASKGKEPEIPLFAQVNPGKEMQNNTNAEDKSVYEAIGQRMIALLEKIWSLGVHDDEATEKVLEVVVRIGTIESARLCNELYQKYSSKYRQMSLIVVFEAYLEAIKRETDIEKIQDIIEEVLELQDMSPMSSHKVERLLQAGTILNCLASADMGKKDGICAKAELMVQCALRERNFLHFMHQLESDNPDVDAIIVPIANYLAQLYATSGDTELEVKAVKLLKYAMTDSCDGFNALTIYPTADACNAVLKALAQSARKNASSIEYADYAFSLKVLKHMFRKAEMGCAPNQTTYDCLFSILEAVDKKWGPAGEDLLSLIETSNMLYVSNAFSLPYRTYCRVLHHYLKKVKESTPSTGIDEKLIPHRRAAYLLRKIEIRSTPTVLHNIALDDIAVKSLYTPHLRPNYQAYELVIQICANTPQVKYQEEAADVAIEIYRTRFQHKDKAFDRWDRILENCSNQKLVERVKVLKEQNL